LLILALAVELIPVASAIASSVWMMFLFMVLPPVDKTFTRCDEFGITGGRSVPLIDGSPLTMGSCHEWPSPACLAPVVR